MWDLVLAAMFAQLANFPVLLRSRVAHVNALQRERHWRRAVIDRDRLDETAGEAKISCSWRSER